MAATSQQVVNEALNLIGYDGPAITGVAPTFDSSTAGLVAANVYAPSVAAVARAHAWSFARTVAALVATGNTAPFPWSFEYAFPANCVDVWQVTPQSIVDSNNPAPTAWARGTRVVGGNAVSVIWASGSPANAVFNSNPPESTWDPIFRQAVVDYLAHRFAIANLGKPDLQASYLEEFGQKMQIGMQRDDQ